VIGSCIYATFYPPPSKAVGGLYRAYRTIQVAYYLSDCYKTYAQGLMDY
jgi:hypothetical protein